MKDNQYQEKRLIRSFGRIKSRKLSNHKQDLYENLLPKYEIILSENSITKSNIFDKEFSEIHLEIGFGFGDFLFQTAKNNPNIGFLACETHINGIINLLSKLEKEPLPNIKIFKSDIRLLLEKIKEQIFKKIYILFPDPWPKTKHNKRRLINEDFLQTLSKKTLPNSQLTIATDHDSYKQWIMSIIIKNQYFKWEVNSKKDWEEFPSDWIYTKYQKKALREGRKSVIINTKII